MGPKVPVDATITETDTKPPQDNNDDESVTIKKTKEHPKTERVYRKRKSSVQDATDDEEEVIVDKKSTAKKVHLQSNLDADSDFSIDSDSEDEEKDGNEPAKVQHQPTDVPSKDETQPINFTTESQVQLENVTKDQAKDEKAQSSEIKNKESNGQGDDAVEEVIKSEPKIDKKKIWEKRTIGDVLVGAIQRYFERKQLRAG